MPVILVVVDTLRADRIGIYGHDRPTSPRLDARAAAGRVYERAFATSPWTLPSFASLYTGRLPSRHGAGIRRDERRFTAIDASVPVLAEMLQARGFATAAVVDNPYLDPVFGVARGFEHYDFAAGANDGARKANEMVDAALRWLDGHAGGPFFLVLHIVDPHMEYDPAPATRGRFTSELSSSVELPIRDPDRIRSEIAELDEDDKRFISAAYDEEVAFVDLELDRFFRELEARGLFDEALVILTADHGEELFDHGFFEHGHEMWEELIRIPMIVWGPGVVPGRESSPVSLVDAVPTVLEALDASKPADVEGRSLWPNLTTGQVLPARTIYAERPLIGPDLRMALRWPLKIVMLSDGSRVQLNDLDADPSERRPIDGRLPEGQAMIAEMQRLLAGLEAEADVSASAIPKATVQGLRSLGYVR